MTASALNSGTIKDAAGNTADLTGAVANPTGILQIDTTTPTITGTVANQATTDQLPVKAFVAELLRARTRPALAMPQPERARKG